MRKRQLLRRGFIVWMLAVLFIVAACSNNGNKQEASDPPASSSGTGKSTDGAKEADDAALEPVTLTVGAVGAITPTAFPNMISDEIAKRTGITMKVTGLDDNKLKVGLASGDLPDLFMVRPDMVKQVIEGKRALPMDDLLQKYGQNITKYNAPMLEFGRKFWSDDSHRVYFVTPQAGPNTLGYESGLNWMLRWNYYKELGYPEIRNADDLVGVLEQMVKNHPTTPDGKKVYAFGVPNINGLWGYWFQIGPEYGFADWSITSYVVKVDDNTIVSNYSDVNSPLWRQLDFMFKANQRGLLHPDTFTMGYEEYVEKLTSGELLFNPAPWTVDNARLFKEQGDRFVPIPVEGNYDWSGMVSKTGSNFYWAISANSKHPEQAMRLLDLLNSPDGARLAASGIKGVHWDIIDGKAQMTKEAINLSTAGGPEWEKTGIGQFTNLMGLGNNTLHPDDGRPMRLLETPEVYALKPDQVEKDYSQHYGATYPGEVIKKMVESGKMKDFSSLNTSIGPALEAAPDNILRIDTRVEDMMLKGIPKVVLSKTAEEYEANKKSLIDSLKAAGADDSAAWWNSAWDKAKAAVQ